MDLRLTIHDLRLTSVDEQTTSPMPVWLAPRASRFPSPRPSPFGSPLPADGRGVRGEGHGRAGRGRMLRCRSAKLSAVSGRRTCRIFELAAACPLFPCMCLAPQPRSKQGRGLQAASRCAISLDVSVPPYPRVCATWKRRKRRAPSARAETPLNTGLPVREGQGERNPVAAQHSDSKGSRNVELCESFGKAEAQV